MKIDAEKIKQLRKSTGAGFLDCKKALEENNGDVEKAAEFLRKKGIANAVKKMSREANQGIIEAYIHPGAQLGVMVEINCETDFVARTAEFKELAHEIAMHIAIADPKYVKSEDVPEDVLKKEKEIYAEQMKNSGKPANVIDKIVEGKINKFYKEVCLLEQQYARDNSITIHDLIKSFIAKLGENITVRRFARFKIGEE
ncbi:translation elongation factor Ts [candidate division WOR-3 bacterium]|nr:translation elongation factor Ts [candidate division WOR-3 bacterium]